VIPSPFLGLSRRLFYEVYRGRWHVELNCVDSKACDVAKCLTEGRFLVDHRVAAHSRSRHSSPSWKLVPRHPLSLSLSKI
jgi:hypothetical protein